MRRDHRFGKAAVAGMALSMTFMLGAAARGEDYGPGTAAAALQQLPGWRCSLNLGCPISGDGYAALTGALAGDREAQYNFARLLQRGDGIPRDVRAATGWYGKAAEQGHVAAALELNRLRHEGADIPADEAQIAAALRLEVDKSDRDAMRALADMQVYGRGLPRDAEQGLALLRRAAGAGSATAAEDLSKLFLGDVPGIPRNPAEGFRWMSESAHLGNATVMLDLGSMYFNFPDAAMRDAAEGYRWLMRAALVDNPAAQEMLSAVLAQGARVGARTVIPPDPIAADMWLRLAARSPFHDNASQRLQIEANMTTAQLAEAKNRAAAWHPSALDEVLAVKIPLPAVAGAKPPWPPELHGRALDRFKGAGENPPLWLRMPDFARNEEVMPAITAIAAQCDGSGNKHCVKTCRELLDYVAPPIKPGGLSSTELARYLREHPEVSPVRAMRKEAATPEEAMHFWALCANGVEDGL
jgi:TPR repeat protein